MHQETRHPAAQRAAHGLALRKGYDDDGRIERGITNPARTIVDCFRYP